MINKIKNFFMKKTPGRDDRIPFEKDFMERVSGNRIIGVGTYEGNGVGISFENGSFVHVESTGEDEIKGAKYRFFTDGENDTRNVPVAKVEIVSEVCEFKNGNNEAVILVFTDADDNILGGVTYDRTSTELPQLPESVTAGIAKLRVFEEEDKNRDQ